MLIAQISPFQYVSILVSIILGLGITHTLASFSELLYERKKIKLYWPHCIWVIFVLFLHAQYWIIIYDLKKKESWRFVEMIFVLLYPVCLFLAAKMLLPAKDGENRYNMKKYYFKQFPIIFVLISACIILSITFNMYYLNFAILDQIQLFVFLGTALFIALKRLDKEWIHKTLAILILVGSILSVVTQHDIWLIE